MSSPAPHLMDEILENIFLRLPTPVGLARVSTACPRFRRIINERSFLRRYRKRHPPPLLGFADESGFHPAQAPHPSAPLARALADAADFTYSFVPRPNDDPWSWSTPWIPCDVRDGRVLLENPCLHIISDLAVCDPLSRRYVLLPPIPRDLAAQEQAIQFSFILAPLGEDEDETSFKVICLARYKTKLVAFVFSSVTQQWCVASSISWSSLNTTCPSGWPHLPCKGCRGLSCFSYVRGCFYTTSPWMDKLLVLDSRTMEFSTINDRTGYHLQLRHLPGQAEDILARDDYPFRIRPGQNRSLPAIVVGREGSLEMFSLVGDHRPNGSFDLYHTTQQNNGESSQEWQLDNIIPLPTQYDYFTIWAAEGFLFLGATTEDQPDLEDTVEGLYSTDWDVDYFSLEVQTSELTKVCRRKRHFFHSEDVYWYFGFPPSLSKPSI